jgi:hypothetical protein
MDAVTLSHFAPPKQSCRAVQNEVQRLDLETAERRDEVLFEHAERHAIR